MARIGPDWRVDNVTASEAMLDASTAAIARLVRVSADVAEVASAAVVIRDETLSVDASDRAAVIARTDQLTDQMS